MASRDPAKKGRIEAIRNEATATSETDAGPDYHLDAGGETQGGGVCSCCALIVPSLCSL